MRGGRGGTRWEGPLAGFELLAAFSFSAVCAEEMSSPAGMTQGSHTANAPRWLSRFRAKSPAAPPATARLCRHLGSALCAPAAVLPLGPGPSAGRPFPRPHLWGPSERAASERCASTVTGDCPPPRQLWPPRCLHPRRRSGDIRVGVPPCPHHGTWGGMFPLQRMRRRRVVVRPRQQGAPFCSP